MSNTKEELIRQKESLENEIERLQKIIDASSETTFEIIMDDLKNQMIESVRSENWTTVKSYIKEIESVNGTKSFIEKQSSLLTKKKEELEEIKESIENYQPSLFEQNKDIKGEAEETEFQDSEGYPYKTGDVYEYRRADTEGENYEVSYYLIKKSAESPDKFAIVSNTFDDELLMHYPKNRECLNDAILIGNVYEDWTDPADETTNNMHKALNAIADSQEQTENADDKHQDGECEE